MIVLAWLLLLQPAPLRYVWAEAHHVLPETTSEESGYFSLCESAGKIFVGTAKYGANSYLVEFDPTTGRQRIALDVHAVCGLTAAGYAAQSKLHTRNFVAPGGRIYAGSKQGYRKKDDTSEYPGGYVLRYDPATGRAESLGMPLAGQGVIDVVADEARGLLYVVTCEEQHWMIGDLKSLAYRELGPLLTPYASTLLGPAGRAHAITKEFKLATYDPKEGRVAVRDIVIDGEPWSRPNDNSIPTWNLAADGRTACLILMNDARLVRIDLETARAARLGKMVEGRNPDSRCGLSIAPDGRVYAIVRVDNQTGFGDGYPHVLSRYDPAAGTIENLGVVAVRNPHYFDFSQKKPWTHGFHRLPDGILTPLHVHMALFVGRDGTVWVTSIYPFTLLRIDPYDLEPRAPKKVAAVTTIYHRDSHADLIVGRLLQTDTLDG